MATSFNLFCRTSSIYPSGPHFPPLLPALCPSAILHGDIWTGLSGTVPARLANGSPSRRLGYLFLHFAALTSLDMSLKLGMFLGRRSLLLKTTFPSQLSSSGFCYISLLLHPIGLEEVTAVPPILASGSCTTSVPFPQPIPSFVDRSSFEK